MRYRIVRHARPLAPVRKRGIIPDGMAMRGEGHTVEFAGDSGLARQWCYRHFGAENPNVWSTREPGWSIRCGQAHFTDHESMVLFMMVWG
jgi:hypothetical protein